MIDSLRGLLRVPKRAALAAGFVITMGLLAACVGNPGSFTITMQEGSQFVIEEDDGTSPRYILDIGTPACAEGTDNDLDGLVDTADPECDSATDNSERVNGVQAYTESTQPVQVAADGTMTYNPANMTAAPREQCFEVGSELWCLQLTLAGVSGSKTGSVGAGGLTLPTSLEVQIDAATGFAGLGADCEIGPIEAGFVADSYNETTGESQYLETDASVPAATGCGDWTGVINDYLGLPATGNAVLETTILNSNGQPVDVS